MLAYELFLKNKDSTKRFVEKLFPIKKVFYNDGVVKLDENIPEDYASDIDNKFSELQEILSAPLNDSSEEKINLPDQSRGGNSYHNFVKLSGNFKIINPKSKEIIIKLTTLKPNSFYAIFNSKKGRSFDAIGKLSLKLNFENYFIGQQSLIDGYRDSKILDDTLSFDAGVFIKICTEIFDHISAKIYEGIFNRPIETNFEIYVLPNKNHISIKKTQNNKSFIDSFGNRGTGFSKETTHTVSFLSCDDPAFAINLNDRYHRNLFYENLGISEESLQKIELSASDKFNISGLSWFFLILT